MNLDMGEIESELDLLVDEKYREGMKTAVPTRWTIRGVRVPDLKRIARERSGGKKTEEDYLACLGFIDLSFRKKDRELTVVGANILRSMKKYFDRRLWEHGSTWALEFADWEVCDIISCYLIGELLLKGKIDREDLFQLRDRDNVFTRRAFIVSRLFTVRKGMGVQEHLDDVMYFAPSREKYIVKALSWILREAAKSEPLMVEEILGRYGETLHPSVVREVRNKLQKGTKR